VLGELQTFSNAYRHRDEPIDVADQLHQNAVHASPDTSIVVRASKLSACAIHADPERFNSTIRKLIDNAMLSIAERRLREPNLRGEIVLQSWQRGSRTVIAVDDNGVGICARARERLFDPFFTTRANGFGLGLALVKQFANHYGGSVRAVNKKTGCRIELVLPSSVATQVTAVSKANYDTAPH